MTKNHDHGQNGKDGHSHEGSHKHGQYRASTRAGMDNWRQSRLPFGEKLRLAMRNNLTKLRNRSSCCGHPGEPGC